MSDKYERIQGGNEVVISTVLYLFSLFVSDILFCAGNTRDTLKHTSYSVVLSGRNYAAIGTLFFDLNLQCDAS